MKEVNDFRFQKHCIAFFPKWIDRFEMIVKFLKSKTKFKEGDYKNSLQNYFLPTKIGISLDPSEDQILIFYKQQYPYWKIKFK